MPVTPEPTIPSSADALLRISSTEGEESTRLVLDSRTFSGSSCTVAIDDAYPCQAYPDALLIRSFDDLELTTLSSSDTNRALNIPSSVTLISSRRSRKIDHNALY